MIKLEITLTDGEVLIESVDTYDKVEMLKDINNRQDFAMVIGDSIINKMMIKRVSPVVQA